VKPATPYAATAVMDEDKTRFGRAPLWGLAWAALALWALAFCPAAMAGAGPDPAQTPRDRAVELCEAAYAAFTQGNIAGAYEQYKDADKLFQDLAREHPADAGAQRDLAVLNDRLGDLYVRMNKGVNALGSYERSIRIDRKLCAADPGNVQVQGDLVLSCLKLGDLYVWLAKADKAVHAYEQGLAACERLSEIAPPESLDPQLSRCMVWYRLGRLYGRLGQADKADAARQKETDIRKALLASTPDKGQEAIFETYRNLGEQYLLLGQAAASIDAFQACLEPGDALVRADPSDMRHLWRMSTVFRNLGQLHMQSGQLEQAFSAYQQVLDILGRLSTARPDDAGLLRDAMVTHYKLGEVLEAGNDPASALKEYEAAMAVAEKLSAQQGEDGLLRHDMGELRKKIDGLGR